MTRSLRTAIADDEPDMQEYYRTILPKLGHVVVAVAETGSELIEKCRDQRPDLAITDVKMPDRDGIDGAAQIYRDSPVPVIIVSAYHDGDLIRRAQEDHIMSYLVKPIKEADLKAAIAIVVRPFEQFEKLRQEIADLKQAVEHRKLIQRAKGLLMKKADLDETEAFQRLQTLTSNQHCKLVDIARAVLTAEDAFDQPKPARRRIGRH